jgi:ribose-phosphate pyrophosphokinase
MIDTLKTYNATHVTVIFPYFPYSRQDKPSHQKREVAQTVLAADQLVRAGADNLISYHPHSTSLAGQKDRPYEYISGIDLFASVFSEYKKDPNTVAVSTDSGGSKETKALAKRLGIAYCPGIKDRPKHEKVETIGVGGDLEGKTRAIVMDDETASFSSVLGVLELISRVGVKEINVGISHTRLSADHLPKLVLAHEKYNMVAYHTTDSVPQIEALSKLPFVHIHSLANMWANVINRLHYTSSVSKLFPSYESK